jgi:hypothetical protein
MNHIAKIDDALAWCRFGSIYKQCDVYKRGDKHYLKHGSGYIRICEQYGDEWLTTVPTIKVLEVEGLEL